MNKTRILFLLPVFGGGGSERTIVNLVKSLSPERFDIYVYVLKNQGTYKAEIPPHVTVIALSSFFMPKKLRYAFLHLPFIILRLQPHLIMSSIFSMNILAIFNKFVLFFLNIKYILRQTERIRMDKKNINHVRKSFFKFIYNSSNGNVALSEGVKNEMCQIVGIHPNKVQRIYNPVDFKNILEKKNMNPDVLDPFLTKKNLLISVGRLSKEKNPLELLKAILLLKDKYDMVANLMILGSGNLRMEIINFIQWYKLHDQIKLYDFLANPYYYISKADMLVLTSLWEGFGHVMVEAMACETLVISSNCEYGPLEIIQDGYNGRLYKLGDIHNLAEIIKYYLLNPNAKKEMVSHAKQNVMERFSINKITKEYEDYFLKVNSQ